jgi:DNA-binding Lrp family transcriptional regulator
MSKRKNPDTSNEAYRSITPDMLSDIYQKILKALERLGNASGQQIAMYLTLDDNKISRRLKEMEGLGLIYNTGLRTPTKSGRSAFQWALKSTGIKPVTKQVDYSKKIETAADIASNIINQTAPKYKEQQLF